MKIQISILLSYIVTCPFESSFIYRSKVNPVGYLLYCENKKIQGGWIFQGDSFRNKPRLRRGYFPIGKGWSGEKFYTGKSRGLKSFTPAHEKSFSRGVFLIRPGPSPALLNFNRYHARSHLARIKISRASPASILFLSPWIIERDQPLRSKLRILVWILEQVQQNSLFLIERISFFPFSIFIYGKFFFIFPKILSY